MVDTDSVAWNHDIAVIGMSARFPEAENYNEFWDRLEAGKSCITEIPEERWDWKKYYKIHGKIKNRTVNHWGGFMKDMSTFDYRFFLISKREADNMDPQQRILMEESWACMEDAGICPSDLSGKKVGVYIAGCNTDFKDLLERNHEISVPHHLTGSSGFVMANRISYYYNLTGPSVQIDTACSGSLAAIHYGIEAILNGECEMALAGAANVMIAPDNYVRLAKMLMLSPTGQVRVFDKDADGYVRGEGVGMVLLKPLSKAVRDGDTIHGIIKATAINHCGHTKSLTYPRAEGQAEVIERAIQKAGISLKNLGYIELHGTGTPKGDPIEFNGIQKAFQDIAEQQNVEMDELQCALGSVKTNIGHLENAAGMASLIKVILAMKNQEIPPTLNFKQLNPLIKIEDTPFHLAVRLEPWKTKEKEPRYAGISSFGLGGTNVHLILQEYIEEENKNMSSEQECFIFALSAKSKEQLKRRAEVLKDYLDSHKDEFVLGDISYTLLCGREHFEERMAFTASTLEEVSEKLGKAVLEAAEQKENNYTDEILYNIQCEIKNYQDDKSTDSYRKKLNKLVEAYENGADIKWKEIFDKKWRKKNLPTYPFAQTECWIPERGLVEGVGPLEDEKEDLKEADGEIITYQEVWKDAHCIKGEKKKAGAVLVFLPWEYRNYTWESSKENTTVFYIEESGSYQRISDNRIQISVDSEEDYIKAAGEFQKQKNISVVLDFFALGAAMRQELYYPAYILKALWENKIKNADILSAAEVFEPEDRQIAESRIGYERSVSVVMPEIKMRFILADEKSTDKNKWFSILWNEYLCGETGSVFYQNGKRMKLSIEEMVLSKKTDSGLREKGVYLITGGAGGLGRMFARYLLEKYHASVVLTGRSSAVKKQDVVEELLKAGGQVDYVQADVSSKEDMQKAVDFTVRKYGHINGVIYAAGVENENSILTKTREEFEMIVSIKIDGARILEQVLEEENPEFICYFSSSSAVIGDFGSCDYAIGNRFLQSYAQCGPKTGKTRRIAINWPMWENGGLAMKDKEVEHLYLKASGQTYLKDADGLRLFEEILASENSQVLLLAGVREKIEQFLKVIQEGKNRKEHITVKLEQSMGQEQKRKITVDLEDEVPKEQKLLLDLMEISAQILCISKEEFQAETNFADIGYDSVNLGDFSENLSERYQIQITPDVFFGYPTFGRLSAYLIEKYPDVMEAFYDAKKELKENKREPEVRIEEVEKKSFEPEQQEEEQIAIVGMSGVFPNADNVEELWDILYNQKEVIEEVPEDRILFDENQKQNKNAKTWRMGMVMNPAAFDPLFFDISPSEAQEMDPRQRLLLEETWKALEDAGMNEKDFDNGNIGMFVGAEDGDYRMMVGKGTRFTSNHNGVMASRLAYLLNFHGPCMSINTACSSSLSAFHQAYLSIKNGDCDMAVVAGANLVLRQENYMDMANAGMLSDDNRCYAFDKRASGMIPADAVAVVVLKKLSQAEKDHNYIYGVIAGSGCNYDGKTNGITAPSGSAQKKLYQSVYDRNGINPKDISYIVTHGTGTKLGDPIEINALTDAFSSYDVKPESCAITSIKPNIGHALAASGVVSIISLLLAMQHEVIPASINSEEQSNYIHWEKSPLFVNRENRSWKDKDGKCRIGGVSSFGMSGTNIHVLLKSYPNVQNKQKQQSYYLMVISAKTEKALEQKIEDMLVYLEGHEDIDMASVSYTLLEGRCQFKYRCAVVVKDREDFIHMLRETRGNTVRYLSGQVDREFYEKKREQNEIKFLLKHMEGRTKSEMQEQLITLGRYYCMGYVIDGNQLLGGAEPVLTKLPTYAFENTDYWIEDKPVEMALVPRWRPKKLTYEREENTKRSIIICKERFTAENYAGLFLQAEAVICEGTDSIDIIAEKIQQAGTFSQVVWIQEEPNPVFDNQYRTIIENQNRSIFYLFKVVKALLKENGLERKLTFYAVTKKGQDVDKTGDVNPDSASVYGFCGVLSKEIPNWTVRVFDVEELEKPADRRMFEIDMKSGSIAVNRQGIWYQRLMENEIVKLQKMQNKDVLKKNGVYIVIGGAGDVGCLWTEHAVRNYHVQVIWIGRREEDETIFNKKKEVAAYGVEPVYYSADVTDAASLQRVYQKIVNRYGKVNGVIHSAVGDFDHGIYNMQEEEFRKVMEVKTIGSINVETVFGKENPDFILYFSSSSSLDMPLGQAGYVSGCCFIDAFSNRVAGQGQHVSKTINWGFWGAIGAGKKMPESIKARIHLSGARPLAPFQAFTALDKLMISEWNQIEYTKKTVTEEPELQKLKKTREQKQSDSIEQYCRKFVVHRMCSILKLSENAFDIQERFEKYGIDSITILQLIDVFQKEIPGLESTVFYECQTTQELIQYIQENHKETLREIQNVKNAENVPEWKKSETLTVMQENSRETEKECHAEDIAVIGMSGRFPFADSIDDYWNNLRNGMDCVTEIPESRWSLKGFYEADMEKAVAEKKSYCKYGGFINGFSEFDPRFFKISPREAMTMDPQERLLLEESYKLLEDAAYPSIRLKEECQSDVGVFIGITRNGFELYNQKLWDSGDNRMLSTSFSAMANRISYTFNLKGPSMAVDTMCSSSLTALHEACEHIRRGECRMALVGAANIYTHPATYRSFCEKRMLSPKGKCHAFGKEADGFVPGEAVAAILLKPLSEAEKDHDQILGVIRASSVNHDGRTNGFTVPNPAAQTDLVRKALDKSGINARQISYVEAHGTGTKLGDPIEMNALTKAYRKDTKELQYCSIGSVKTNIGHCEAAAGLAGVIKVLLQMKNGLLVPSLHSQELNPLIRFADTPFYVQHGLEEWKKPLLIQENGTRKEYPRMAAVSAFGAGGSNAHVIIEEYCRNL